MSNKYNSENNVEFYRKADKSKNIRINYHIKSTFCRVIEQNSSPRIMKTIDAISYAEGLGLDLVEIGYDKVNNCSNCKICDYSKYVYEQKKREKEAKKQARANKVDVKSVQLTLTTDVADKERMIRHAKEFILSGDKVKISLRFRNRRELENLEMAKNIIKEILVNFDGIAVLDSTLNLSGKELSCIIRKA